MNYSERVWERHDFYAYKMAGNDQTCGRCLKEETNSPVGQQQHFGQQRA